MYTHILTAVSILAATLHVDAHAIELTKRTSSATGTTDGVADIARIMAGLRYSERKIFRGLDAYRVNLGLGPIHPLSRRASSFPEPLTDVEDGQLWSGKINVGTPPKSFVVDFDTGSSDIFLPSVNCSKNCDGHARYDTSKSSTAKDQKKTFSIAFGDGSNVVSGEIFTDVVSVGKLKATGQALGSANQYAIQEALSTFPPDGLVGMGFPSLSGFALKPFFHTLIDNKQLSQPIFSMALTPTNAELFLGGSNPKRMKGATTWIGVTRAAYWQIPLDNISIKGKKGVVVGKGSAIVDSGTTLIIGNATLVEGVYKAIPGSKKVQDQGGITLWSVPCKSIPTILFSLGSKSFAIPPSTFNLGTVSANNTADCVGGIAGLEGVPVDWVLGDVFMGGVYTTFDVGKKRVGFTDLA